MIVPQHVHGDEKARSKEGNDEREVQPQDLQIPPEFPTRFKGSSQQYLELEPHQQGRAHCGRPAQA
jgi:hypothetical protein